MTPYRGNGFLMILGATLAPKTRKVTHFGEMLGSSSISIKMGENPNISPKWVTFSVLGAQVAPNERQSGPKMTQNGSKELPMATEAD